MHFFQSPICLIMLDLRMFKMLQFHITRENSHWPVCSSCELVQRKPPQQSAAARSYVPLLPPAWPPVQGLRWWAVQIKKWCMWCKQKMSYDFWRKSWKKNDNAKHNQAQHWAAADRSHHKGKRKEAFSTRGCLFFFLWITFFKECHVFVCAKPSVCMCSRFNHFKEFKCKTSVFW